MALKNRESLIEDIKCLEIKLSHLQERFDVVVTWIRSHYCELTGLPDFVLIAIRGDRPLSDGKNEFRKIEHVKVEYDNVDDSTDGSTYLNSEEANQCNTVAVKVDEEIFKDIESGPVSRLSGRELSTDENGQRYIIDLNPAATIVHEGPSSFPLSIVGDVNSKLETNQLVGENSNDCNKTDEENNDDNSNHSLRDVDTPSRDFRSKRVIQTMKRIKTNKGRGWILDAFEYKQRVASLPTDRLSCIVCSKVFSTPMKLRRHEHEVHLTKEDQKKLRNRNVKLKNVELTMCDLCNKPFKNIESHKMNHLSPEVVTTVEGSCRPHYRCLKCASLFSEKKKYLDHSTRECKAVAIQENSNDAPHTQQVQTEKNFLCNQCGQTFNRQYTLKIHIAAVHAKRKDFKCQYCQRAFTVENVKNKHESKHLRLLSVKCDLCGFTFACKRGLKKHIAGVHENRRPYQCHLCEKSFKTTHARKYHVNTHGNPNGRQRGLNRDVDPMHAAAKRRHCITWEKNRLQLVQNSTTVDDAKDAVAEESDENN